MDEIDRKILQQLYLDSSRTQKEIADSVNITEPTLSKRIRALRQDGVIKRFSADLDYAQAGYNVHCITLIKLEKQDLSNRGDMLKKLRSFNEVVEVYSAFGDYDFCVRWLCASNAKVQLLLDEAITPDVHVKTIVLAQEYKRERGPNIE